MIRLGYVIFQNVEHLAAALTDFTIHTEFGLPVVKPVTEYAFCDVILFKGWLPLTLRKLKLSFLTHGYSVGVAVSYSWDFLKFCETMNSIFQPALRGWFMCLDTQCLLL